MRQLCHGRGDLALDIVGSTHQRRPMTAPCSVLGVFALEAADHVGRTFLMLEVVLVGMLKQAQASYDLRHSHPHTPAMPP